MKTRMFGFLAIGGLLLAGGPAFAHHSGAMFDHAKTVTVIGTVKEFKWSNPHGWIQVMAPGPGGKPAEWSMECSSINILARKGWAGQALRPGDKISVTMHPMKDGTASGLVLTVKLPDGRALVDHDY